MTDNEILTTGALCAGLLSSSDFTTIIAQYELTIAADLLATSPHETKKREQLYATLWGARGLLEYMRINAKAAATIKDKDGQPTAHRAEGFSEPQYDDEGFTIEDTL